MHFSPPETTKGYDIYLFVFNDVLLLTKPKKIHRKVKMLLDLVRIEIIIIIKLTRQFKESKSHCSIAVSLETLT